MIEQRLISRHGRPVQVFNRLPPRGGRRLGVGEPLPRPSFKIASSRRCSSSVGRRVRAARNRPAIDRVVTGLDGQALSRYAALVMTKLLVDRRPVGQVQGLRDIDGSDERSHEQVFKRSGLPNELRNVLWILVSGSCKLRQPSGYPANAVGTSLT